LDLNYKMSNEELLYQILDNQQLILQELRLIRQANDKVEHHIDFIQHVYDTLRHPINYLTGTSLQAIKMDKNHTESIHPAH
jgi:hypothetical protein